MEKFTPWGLRTGDLAIVENDGYIFIVDRRDDFIKSWGHRISSQEVEAVALRMEQLISAAAIGVPDDEAGEAVTLFVAARPDAGVTHNDVLVHFRKHLPKYMVPRSVLILDALPLNANGKIAKPRLRGLATARPAGPWIRAMPVDCHGRGDARRYGPSGDRHRRGRPDRGVDARPGNGIPGTLVHCA